MEGNELLFMINLDHAIINCPSDHKFLYVEIGVAEGQTLGHVSHLIANSYPVRCGRHWRTVGIDIPNGWSLNQQAVSDNNPHYYNQVMGIENAPDNWSSLILQPAQEALARRPFPAIHFAFIDGCHGKPCAMGDFLALEPLMAPGGIVAFHDASEKCQGHHMQPHCGTGIDVRAALRDLSLLPPCARPGWAFISETAADHACAFFKKLH